ncbi:DUF6458 family protein [Luteipulveratus halotolerans]|uniref:DUF6458 domain-containing protein n=1 Tax=Luteipulveratus halotolerans TaxID=1631356 RepID=A0A0L6CEL6_9MICO|nr:DUF6458 family protein [Luteipulveratus halotolerans]KNX36257.1 hypothetical protein VV01_02445 [Luteipulveratus halotolerans]
MGGGIGLLVFGAILTFAVRFEPKGFDIQTAGVILMIAGIVMIGVNYYGRRRRRTSITRIADDGTVQRTIREDEGEDTTA